MPALAATRLSEADIERMAQRAQTILTPEGAQSWHKIDVTELLAEVRALQGELRQARQCFVDDGVSDDGSLPDLAQAWKAHSTGVYERAVVKRYRTEANQALKAAAESDRLLEAANEQCVQLRAQLDEVTHERDLIGRQFGDLHASAQQRLAEETQKSAALRDEVRMLHDAVRDCKQQAQQQLTMAEALNAERRAEVCERAREILVLLGGNANG